MLRDRFKEFARDTETIGQERVAAVNEICDQLIGAGHSDAATIAEWKDQINEAWADLLELIDTRTQMLAASWELHRFFHDCKETLDRIYVSPHDHNQSFLFQMFSAQSSRHGSFFVVIFNMYVFVVLKVGLIENPNIVESSVFLIESA